MRHVAAILLSLTPCLLSAQVTYERLANAAAEPQNWLTYSGNFMSQRYSPLDQITPANVSKLEQKWVFQARPREVRSHAAGAWTASCTLCSRPTTSWLSTPRTGRIFWIYQYKPSPNSGRAAAR